MVGSPLLIAEKARARLKSVVETFNDLDRLDSPVDLGEMDVVVTPCEVNYLHGTGTLIQRLFPDSSRIISLRTTNFYAEPQLFGAQNYCLPYGQTSRSDIKVWVQWWLNGVKIRRIICFPYLAEDAELALVLRSMFRVPLCTYVMDDKNVAAEGISDALMEELLVESQLRLVISPEMREAYTKKYRLPFWLMPPLVPEELFEAEPRPLLPEVAMHRGVLLGNVWGQRWLELLRDTFRGSGFQVDWYCNQKKPAGLTFDPAALEADGIRFMDPVREADLPQVLAKYPFAVVPSDTLDGQSPPAVQAIAELSLPSRIPTVMTTSHLPFLVLGSPKTCAAQFVKRFELGEITPYEKEAVHMALERLIKPERQAKIRSRAAELSPYFSSKGAGDWILRSMDKGKPCDRKYEDLMPPLNAL